MKRIAKALKKLTFFIFSATSYNKDYQAKYKCLKYKKNNTIKNFKISYPVFLTSPNRKETCVALMTKILHKAN